LAIDSIERSAQLKRVHQDRDFDLSIESYSTYGDPALGIARTFQTASIGNVFGNMSNYSNPELDALLLKGERSTDQQARAQAYKAAQAIIARDLPVMSIRDARTMDGATAKLNGVWEMLGPALWTDAWLAR